MTQPTLNRVTFKSTLAATPTGHFSCVFSTSDEDRQGDVVLGSAIVGAMKEWTASGKKIPLAWHHSTKSEDLVGWIDPSSVEAHGTEVSANGWVDQGTPRGLQVFRLIKSGVGLGFSYGFMTLKADPRPGGGKTIREMSIFEISATSSPVNHGTKITSWKAADHKATLRERCDQITRESGPIQVARFPCD